VYVIVAVPVRRPVTTPPDVTDAVNILLLLQVPPVTVLLNVDGVPMQISVLPVIAAGAVFIVIVFVTYVPHIEV
jgi:hypothetical protein